MEPDEPGGGGGSDSDSCSSVSNDENANIERPFDGLEKVVSPSAIGYGESVPTKKQSLVEVVRSPMLMRKTVDIWTEYHKKRRVKRLIIDGLKNKRMVFSQIVGP